MKDRIICIMEHEGMTPSRFAEVIGIQRSAMSHITSGRNNPSLDVVVKVLEQFTYINPDWLIFGKGNMAREEITKEPDLFTNEAFFSTNPTDVSEKRQENAFKTQQITPNHTVIENVILKEAPPKIIAKIMVFYTDNTYDTFVLEKSK